MTTITVELDVQAAVHVTQDLTALAEIRPDHAHDLQHVHDQIELALIANGWTFTDLGWAR